MKSIIAGVKSKCLSRLLFELEKWRELENLRLINKVISERVPPRRDFSSPTLVIGNAIPKSGTYLLNSIINALGGWHNPGLHVMSHALVAMDEGGKSSRTFKSLAVDVIKSMPAGIAVAAHLRYDRRVSDMLGCNSHIKHIFFYRDFRDIFCSFDRWTLDFDEAGHSAVTSHKQKFYRDFFNDPDDSLAYTIASMMEHEHFEGYIPWLNDPYTLCLRFEDIYNEVLDCPVLGFGSHLTSIFEFLSFDTSSLDPAEFAKQVLGKGWTSSGKQKKAGQYRDRFKQRHYRLLENRRFRALMQAYGYIVD